jgi:hypothetical protein
MPGVQILSSLRARALVYQRERYSWPENITAGILQVGHLRTDHGLTGSEGPRRPRRRACRRGTAESG